MCPVNTHGKVFPRTCGVNSLGSGTEGPYISMFCLLRNHQAVCLLRGRETKRELPPRLLPSWVGGCRVVKPGPPARFPRRLSGTQFLSCHQWPPKVIQAGRQDQEWEWGREARLCEVWPRASQLFAWFAFPGVWWCWTAFLMLPSRAVCVSALGKCVSYSVSSWIVRALYITCNSPLYILKIEHELFFP